MASEIGKAYVQIIPSAEGIQSTLSAELGSAGESAGSQLEQSLSSKIGAGVKGGVKVAGVALASLGAGVIAGSAAFVKSAKDVSAYGDNIDKMSQKIGMSSKAYQEWDFIAQHSGTSMESLKGSFKTMSTQAQGNAAEFQKLGISAKEVGSLSKEELFGKVIEGLQGMEEGTERTALASKLLGKGATELGPLLNTSAADTEAMKEKVNELGGVMSDDAVKASAEFQDSLQDMGVAFDGLKNNAMAQFLPAMSGITNGLASLFSGDTENGLKQIQTGVQELTTNLTNAIPGILQVGGSILSGLGQAILDNLPTLVATATPIILQLGQGLISALPQLIQVALQIIQQLALGLAQALPTLIPQVSQVILTIVQTLTSNVGLLINAAVELVIALVTGLANSAGTLVQASITLMMGIVTAIPQIVVALVKAAPQIITGIIKGITSAFGALGKTAGEIGSTILNKIKGLPGKMLSQGGELILKAVSGIKGALGKLGSAAGSIVSTVVNGLRDLPGKMISAGKDIIKGLWNGISNMSAWIGEKIKGFGKSVLGGIKKFFGIKSPSRVMRDQVGKNIALGMAEGITRNASAVYSAMEDLETIGSSTTTSVLALSGTGASGGIGPVTMNIYGAPGQDIKTLADEIDRRLAMKAIRGGAYA